MSGLGKRRAPYWRGCQRNFVFGLNKAITFAAIGVILFAPRADQAYATGIGFTIGSFLTVVIVAALVFAALPNVETFATFSLIIGLALVPLGAVFAIQWQPAIFTGMITVFVPLLAPTNPMSYDPQQYYNAALAIVPGVGAAVLSFRLLPPLSPAFRTRRLLTLTLRDLRRLATGPIPRTPGDWEGRMFGRFAALPNQAQPLQRSQLMAAFSVGSEIIQLRHIVSRLELETTLERRTNRSRLSPGQRIAHVSLPRGSAKPVGD